MIRRLLLAAAAATCALAARTDNFAVVGSATSGIEGSAAQEIATLVPPTVPDAEAGDFACRQNCRSVVSGRTCTRYTYEIATGTCTIYSGGSIFATDPATTPSGVPQYYLGGLNNDGQDACSGNSNVGGTTYNSLTGPTIPTGGCVTRFGVNRDASVASNPAQRVRRQRQRRSRLIARADRERAAREA